MSVLFGDDSVKEELDDETENTQEKENQNVVKKPIWQKQNKKSKNVKNKKHSKKSTKSSSSGSSVAKNTGENGSVVGSKSLTDKKEKEKDCGDSESGLSDDDDRSDDYDENDGDQGDKKVHIQRVRYKFQFSKS